MKKAVVALKRTSPEKVLGDYAELMRLAGFPEGFDVSARTILKPDVAWHRFMPGANPPPWQLDGVAQACLDAGVHDLSVVLGRAPEVEPHRAELNNRYIPVYNRHHLEVRYAHEPEDIEWTRYHPRSKLPALEAIFPEGFRVPSFFLGTNIIHLSSVRTHVYSGLAGAVKAGFGALLDENRFRCLPRLDEVLVDLLALQRDIHRGVLAVADGTTCGDGAGPRCIIPQVKDIIAASSDPLALDAVLIRILGLDPLSIPWLRLAESRGLGCATLDEIEVRGMDISDLNFGFSIGSTPSVPIRKWAKAGGLGGRLIRPVIESAVLAEAAARVYHDRLWYPLWGRASVRTWKQTRWGRLFERYSIDRDEGIDMTT